MEQNKETLCFVNIVFPFTNTADLIALKDKLDDAMKELSEVKIDFRMTQVRCNASTQRLHNSTEVSR